MPIKETQWVDTDNLLQNYQYWQQSNQRNGSDLVGKIDFSFSFNWFAYDAAWNRNKCCNHSSGQCSEITKYVIQAGIA